MLSHIKQTDVSVPFRDGDWWYYSRTEEGLQYAIHCRKEADACRASEADATEEVILDGNKLAEGHAFFSDWRHRNYRRWALAGIHHRHDGFSPIHAAHQGP